MRGVNGDMAMLVACSTEIGNLIGDQTNHGMQSYCHWNGFHWARVRLPMESYLA